MQQLTSKQIVNIYTRLRIIEELNLRQYTSCKYDTVNVLVCRRYYEFRERKDNGGRSYYEPGGSNRDAVHNITCWVGPRDQEDFTVDWDKTNQAHVHWDKFRIVPKEKIGAQNPTLY